MTKQNHKRRGTKTAFLTSLLSLILCVTMLIGTTLAWFTDTVTSGENQIIAGNLDVDVEYYDTTDSSWKTIAGSDSLFDKNALWEPGHTEYVTLRIVNKGTLAFNYALDVTPVTEQAGENQAGGSFKLSDYLVFSTSEPAAAQVTYADRAAARSAAGTTQKLNQTDLRRTGVLYAASDTNKPDGGMSEVYTTLVVYMPETVGNEANYRTGTTPPQIDLGVKVYAWQEDYEEDSFGDDYDILGIDAEGSGVKDASYTKVDNVSAVVAEGVNTTFVSNITPAMTGAADEKTTVTIPTGTVGFETGDNTMLTVSATSVLPASRTAAFNIVDARGSVGAIDLTVTVNDKVVSEFKDADGADVPVTVTTYIAKGLTLNDKEDKVAIKYVGDNGSDPTLVSYDTDTGKLVFTTTHFSTFAIGADQAAYIARNNTAYFTLKAAVEASEENDEIIMLKDSTIGVKKVIGAVVLGGKTINPGTTVDDGGFIEISKNLSIDFNGKTIRSSISGDRCIHLHDCTLTINGNAANEANPGEFIVNNSGSYGLIKVYADSNDTTLTVNNLKMSGDTDNGALIKAFDGTSTGSTITLNINKCEAETNIRFQDCNSLYSKLTLNVTGGEFSTGDYTFAHDSYNSESKATFTNVKATSKYGPIIEVAGTHAEFTDCDFKITDIDTDYEFKSVTIGVSYDGTATINGGTYTSDKYDALQIYPTGGTLDISAGTFNGHNNSVKTYETYNGCSNSVNISGGTFSGALDLIGEDTSVNITGGTFNHDYADYIKEGYISTPNGDGTYTVTSNQ